MKKIILLICVLFLFGCATSQQILNLEEKIDKLEKKKASETMLLAEQAGARKFWWRNARTGGGASALDGIEGMVDGDACFVMELSGTTATGYLYIFDAGGGQAESDPVVIDGSGTPAGDWLLVNWNAAAITSNAASGYSYIKVSNPTAFAGTPAEGYCYYKVDDKAWCCYDADSFNCLDMEP